MNVTITAEQAAVKYGVNRGTLANLRTAKQGAPYFKVGRKVLYKVTEFEKWLFQNPVHTVDSIQE